MMAVYRVEFVRPRVTNTVPESPTPICMACGAGHHEQPMLDHECCNCPCHGATPPEFADYRLAA
jgi:hypothetical protein